MYDIQNTGKATHILTDRNGKRVTVRPGGTARNVDLSDRLFNSLTHAAGPLVVGGAGATRRAPAPPTAPPPAATTAADLLARADDMKAEEFKDAARAVLGDRYPAGRPSKDEVIEVLKQQG